jgi:acetolactate synthase-1/2/3 large subunit
MPVYLSSRHEEIALAMASGYAKATGKLPGVMIHTTVGALHGSMALRGALHEQVPMVVFTGESIAFGEDDGPDPGGQWMRFLSDVGGPARLVDRCVKWSFGVNDKNILVSTIQRACQMAMGSPRGPVFVSLPIEYLFDKVTREAPLKVTMPTMPNPDPKGIDELAGLLAAAQNPVIVSENAGANASIVERMVELAEFLNAPVVETRSSGYVNFPRDHELHGGFDPGEHMTGADVVCLIAATQPWHPASSAIAQGAKVVALDEEPLHMNLPYWGVQVDLSITGELEVSLGALLERLRKIGVKGDDAGLERRKRLREQGVARRAAWADQAQSLESQEPMDTSWVMYQLNQVLPEDVYLVEETITHRLALHQYLDRVKPGHFFSGAIGGLGTGLGTALGVKAAHPEKPVVLVIGDGSFNYNPGIAGFGFTQEFRMPILVVLMNNHGYKSMKRGVPEYYPKGWAVRTNQFVGTSIAPAPDYPAIARAFDGFGERVQSPDDVKPALERGLQAARDGRIALVDIWLEPVND